MRGPASDEELVRRVRAGEDDAFAAVYHRYTAELLAYARRVLGDRRALAEDVVQEAFLRTYRALLEEPPRSIALRPWLYAVVRNRAIDQLRAPTAAALGVCAATAAPASSEPSVAAATRAELRAVLNGIAALPERQRRALVLHAVDGVPHERIGRQLHTSPGSSKVLVHRARRALRASAPAVRAA